MGGWLLFGAWLLLARTAAAAPDTPAPAPGSRLTLRNGTVYLLREPPRISGTRVVFTTMDGQLYSMDQTEIESIGAAPRPTRTPRPYYSTEDSRALGALARRDREARGLRAEIAPRGAQAARKRAPAKRRARKPAPRATPKPS